MFYINYILQFTKNLIIKNLVKVLLLVVALISFNLSCKLKSGSFKSRTIITQDKIGKEYLYIFENSSGSSDKYEIYSTYDKEIIKGDKLYYWSSNGFKIFLWVVSGSCLGVVIIFTIINLIDDDLDVCWNIKDINKKSLYNLLRCEYEDGKYYYSIDGRLLGIEGNRIKDHWQFEDRYRIYTLSDVKRLPKFKTKTENRNTKLSELGIK